MYGRLASLLLAVALIACPPSHAGALSEVPSLDDVGAIIESYQRQHARWVQDVSAAAPEARASMIDERPDKAAVARQLAALAESAGGSEAGFMAWAWIYMECDDDTWRNRALRALLDGWADGPEMIHVLPAMERDGHDRARSALTRLSSGSDSGGVSLAASVTLASWLLRFDPDRGRERAIAMLEAVVATDTTVPHPEGGTLAETARNRLFAARRLSIGSTVPDIAGEDLRGQPLKLSDQRGRVVLLTFWAHWCQGCMVQANDERRLIDSFHDRPFVVIGVNCDPGPPEQILRMNREKDVPWRSFRNDAPQGVFGSIARSWNVRTLPTTYLIGHDGVMLAAWEATIAPRDELRVEIEAALERAATQVHDADRPGEAG